MRSLDRKMFVTAAAAVIAMRFVAGEAAAAGEKESFGIGRRVSESELAGWNIDVAPDGAGLPSGRGSVQQGKLVYESKCLACHGAEGQGQPMDRLAGGQGTLSSANPVKTIGSYWPYATTVFDYVRRAMPLDKPQSLSADETYAVTAYLLHLNGIVGPATVMNAQTLPKVQMPNRTAFRSDPRPDVMSSACRTDCDQD
ncbi:MAG: c-type cytochrome [Steroidobacter sp.]